MSIRENPIGPPHLMLRHCTRSASQDNNDPVAESRPASPAFDLTRSILPESGLSFACIIVYLIYVFNSFSFLVFMSTIHSSATI